MNTIIKCKLSSYCKCECWNFSHLFKAAQGYYIIIYSLTAQKWSWVPKQKLFRSLEIIKSLISNVNFTLHFIQFVLSEEIEKQFLFYCAAHLSQFTFVINKCNWINAIRAILKSIANIIIETTAQSLAHNADIKELNRSMQQIFHKAIYSACFLQGIFVYLEIIQ